MSQFLDSRGRKRATGKFRAEVTNNQDPEKRGRVKVKAPALMGEVESDWIDVDQPFPGFFALPDKGTAVYVECSEGDPTYMRASGTWYGAPDDKTDAPFKGDYKCRGWTDPKGNKILTDEDGKIEIISKSGAYYKIDGNNINVKGGNVTVEGSSVTIKNSTFIAGGGASAARVGDIAIGTGNDGKPVISTIMTGSGSCFIGG